MEGKIYYKEIKVFFKRIVLKIIVLILIINHPNKVILLKR
jgi:hypothetical protein